MNRTGHKGRTDVSVALQSYRDSRTDHLRLLIGKRFGRWTVTGVGDRIGERRCLLCICDCGSTKQVAAKRLKKGESKSCGCWRRDYCIDRSTKHGMNQSPEYASWQAMKQRCLDPNAENYRWYGAKGVKVCKEWIESFSAFLEDMGTKPSPDYTIERLNPFGNYEPDNCVWDTWEAQRKNKRNRKVLP